MGIFSTIAHAFSSGGVWMWAILAAQIVSIAIIVERIIALYVLRGTHQKKNAKSFEEGIRKGNIDRVLTRAQNLSTMDPIDYVVKAGGQAAVDMGGGQELQGKLDQVLVAENPRMHTR